MSERKAISLLAFLIISATLFSQGTWVQKTSLPAVEREGAVAFSIGVKGYLGTGVAWGSATLSDFWEYNPATNSWTQKANYGGGTRFCAVGFSIGNKGYIGTGYSSNPGSYNKDFWEYDCISNTWKQLADFGGNGRNTSSGFAIGNFGYLGTGFDGTTNHSDFWKYDPANNSWTKLNDFGGGLRRDGASFVIGDKGYLGLGTEPGWTMHTDFWEYNPGADAWTQKADFLGPERIKALSFSICKFGYFGLGGVNGCNTYSDMYLYDQAANSWSTLPPFPGIDRMGVSSFVIDNKAYVGMGDTYSSKTGTPFFNELWEYSPDYAQPVVATISGDATVCSGSNVSLSATGGIYYAWTTGDTTQSVTVAPTSTTTYSVTVSTNCGSANASSTITAAKKGKAFFRYDFNPCKDKCVQFTNQSDNDLTWHWDFGDGNNGTSKDLCHYYNDSSMHNVTLIINNSIINNATNCVDTFRLNVLQELRDSTAFVYIPNAYSPNGDESNDLLRFYRQDLFCFKEFEIIIYNRWGEQVFATNSIYDTWDGTFKGQALDAQVLSYYCKTTTATGIQMKRKGTITLMR